jgi:hypothetical protein
MAGDSENRLRESMGIVCTSETAVKAKFTGIAQLSIAPTRSAYPRRVHNTSSAYYQNLMYVEFRISGALHKNLAA